MVFLASLYSITSLYCIVVDSDKNKNLIYETSLTNVGFANSERTRIWFDFRFENIH